MFTAKKNEINFAQMFKNYYQNEFERNITEKTNIKNVFKIALKSL